MVNLTEMFILFKKNHQTIIFFGTLYQTITFLDTLIQIIKKLLYYICKRNYYI